MSRTQSEDNMPRIGRDVKEFITIIVDREFVMVATGRPYWEGREWYVDARMPGDPDTEACPVALATVTLPI